LRFKVGETVTPANRSLIISKRRLGGDVLAIDPSAEHKICGKVINDPVKFTGEKKCQTFALAA
jgi:hypothetical protein